MVIQKIVLNIDKVIYALITVAAILWPRI